MKRDAHAIIREINNLWRTFVNCRAHFPCVSEQAIGATSIRTAPYYSRRGFDVHICFRTPLTEKNIEDFLAIGHWINQNFIVRLYALLESHKVPVSGQKVDCKLDGNRHVSLLRALRNVFAHSSGRYNARKPYHKEILKKLRSVLSLDLGSPKEFPLGIDDVLEPLVKGCKAYVKAWAEKGR